MSTNRKAQIATVLLMVAMGAGVMWKQGAFDRVSLAAPEAADPQPQDAIYQALDAIRDGDLPRYLDAHTGSMHVSLLRASAEVGDAQLLESLQKRNAPLKGIAILEPEPLSDREVKARVEYVFADRNELQIYYLEKAGDRWKIARVDGAEPVEPLIPYGTPVQQAQ